MIWFAATLLFAVIVACGQSFGENEEPKPNSGAGDATNVSSSDAGRCGVDKKYSRDEAQLKKLTPLQYQVTQKQGTEAPFRNEYWDNHEAGIYVDVVSGEPLFSSLDKFDSGTGWPSFTRPLDKTNIELERDSSHGMVRTEVRSKHGESHLGHLFDDGPAPTGQRYCMNSASMRFIPVSKLAAEGYGQYLSLFGAVAPSPSPAAKPSAKVEVHEEKAILAGGCFWGMQEILRKIPGVISSRVGYSGGNAAAPSYQMVTTGLTGHAESIEVTFDPTKLSYEQLLHYFFRMHDPTTLNQQHNDVGTQYRSAIFYLNDQQKETAEKVKDEVNRSGKWKAPVVTEITHAKEFYPAEGYHQDYLQKNPGGYTCHFLRDE